VTILLVTNTVEGGITMKTELNVDKPVEALKPEVKKVEAEKVDNVEKKTEKVDDSMPRKGSGKINMSDKMLDEIIKKANRKLYGMRQLEFAVHERTKEIMVKVLDSETNEVIREIPSEKILDIVANMMELSGLFVDEQR